LRYDGRKGLLRFRMLILYAVSALVAGALMLLSLFGGDHEMSHEAEGALESDHHGSDHWLPFFSLRFYTYFFGAFGATGLLLSFLTKTDPNVVGWLAIGTGLVTGLGIAFMIRMLRVTEASGGARESDVLGKEGTVLVAIRGSAPGRIRCSVRGDLIDFIATTEEDRPIEAGESVVVVAMENGRAQVVLRDSIFNERALPGRVS
jgi:membrane protein implicated in regulation of membrane protease activity